MSYWDRQEASDNGVLGGFGHLTTADVRDSRAFLRKARRLEVALTSCLSLVRLHTSWSINWPETGPYAAVCGCPLLLLTVTRQAPSPSSVCSNQTSAECCSTLPPDPLNPPPPPHPTPCRLLVRR